MRVRMWNTTRNSVEAVFWLALLLCEFAGVHGDGVMTVRFIRYRNPDGLGSNGHYCDGKWSVRQSGCDHQFTVCLDKHGGSSGVNSCFYGRSVTHKTKNQDNNVFDDTFGGIPNPLLYKIRGSINIMATLKIRIMDVDSGLAGGDDHVDDLSADIYVHKGPFSEVKLPVTLHERTTMETLITVSCDADWYDEDCSVYCKPSKDDNYYCDGWTGEKICHPGWVGENCDLSEQP